MKNDPFDSIMNFDSTKDSLLTSSTQPFSRGKNATHEWVNEWIIHPDLDTQSFFSENPFHIFLSRGMHVQKQDEDEKAFYICDI